AYPGHTIAAQDAVGNRKAVLIRPFTDPALKDLRRSEIQRAGLAMVLHRHRVDGRKPEVAQLHFIVKEQDVAGFDVAVADGHRLTVNVMLAGIEEVEALGCLAQVEASLI